MLGIGLSYGEGDGVEQDLNEAMRWFLKAKAQGADVSEEVAEVMRIQQQERAAKPKNLEDPA